MLFQLSDPKAREDLWILPLKGEHEAKLLLGSEFKEFDGRFSPDMSRIAYQSDESGDIEVYVCELSETSRGVELEAGERKMISDGGGTGPRWGREGKELYYRDRDGSVMVVEFTGDRFSSPKSLFPAVPLTTLYQSNWDAHPDGDLFLLESPVKNNSSSFNIILNWTSLLEQ